MTALQTVPTLPDDYKGKNSCAQIRMTPSGRFLYAPNRGHNSIASFAVDASTGLLTPTGHAAAEPVPRAFNLDPDGKFLYAPGLESGRLTGFRVGETGRPEARRTYPVGTRPIGSRSCGSGVAAEVR